jgi:p-aminobenzoyl-glutamate transporter AbgT
MKELSPVKKPKTVNVLLVATVSAILHGAAAVVFVPCLSMLMLCFGEPPAALTSAVAAIDNGMLFAVAAPFGYAAIGFLFGGLMACLFNMFVNTLVRKEPVVEVSAEAVLQARSASLGDAA